MKTRTKEKKTGNNDGIKKNYINSLPKHRKFFIIQCHIYSDKYGYTIEYKYRLMCIEFEHERKTNRT